MMIVLWESYADKLLEFLSKASEFPAGIYVALQFGVKSVWKIGRASCRERVYVLV